MRRAVLLGFLLSAVLVGLVGCRMTNPRPSELRGVFGKDATPIPGGIRIVMVVHTPDSDSLSPVTALANSSAATWQEGSCTRHAAVATNVDELLAAPKAAKFAIKDQSSRTGVQLNLTAPIDLGDGEVVSVLCIPADDDDQKDQALRAVENLGQTRPIVIMQRMIAHGGQDQGPRFVAGSQVPLPDLSQEAASQGPASIMGSTWTHSFWAFSAKNSLTVESRALFTHARTDEALKMLLAPDIVAGPIAALPRLHVELKHVPVLSPRKP